MINLICSGCNANLNDYEKEEFCPFCGIFIPKETSNNILSIPCPGCGSLIHIEAVDGKNYLCSNCKNNLKVFSINHPSVSSGVDISGKSIDLISDTLYVVDERITRRIDLNPPSKNELIKMGVSSVLKKSTEFVVGLMLNKN